MKTTNDTSGGLSDCVLRLSASLCLSSCVSPSFLFSFTLSLPGPSRVLCVQVTAWWVSLDFPALSSDLSATHNVFFSWHLLQTHTHAHMHTFDPFFSFFLQRTTFHTGIWLLTSFFLLYARLFSLKQRLESPQGLRIRPPPSQPHVTEERKADLSPFLSYFSVSATGLWGARGRAECTVRWVSECAEAESSFTLSPNSYLRNTECLLDIQSKYLSCKKTILGSESQCTQARNKCTSRLKHKRGCTSLILCFITSFSLHI